MKDKMDFARRYWKAALLVFLMAVCGLCYGFQRMHRMEGEPLVQAEMPLTSDAAAGQEESEVSESVDVVDVSQEAKDEVVLCFVHICGEVVNPGIYQLEEGGRVWQAIEAAGGFTPEAAEEYLNLAGNIDDGMKIVVPAKGEVLEDAYGTQAGEAGGVFPGQQSLGDAKVNLNTATREELMTLKGIGEARAEDIIRYREEQGHFTRIEDVMNVSGIKDAAFQKIKDDITV